MTKPDKNTDSARSIHKDRNPGSSINPEGVDPTANRRKSRTTEEYIEGILTGNRSVLSQAITLIESSRREHSEQSRQIVEHCLPHSGNSVRVGITGVPGAGKSTFIETLGNLVLEKGCKLAVLAVDPSSSKSKGSILGDKTRMETLATHPDAFIRPSPAAGVQGGVTRKTRETIYLCEAAGFDTIFVETVGVGQSEIAVHSMVDFFLLLMLTGAGDELQGIKRGIVEMADAIVINKVDSSDRAGVQRTMQEYKNALQLYPEPDSGWGPVITSCSARSGEGIEEVWNLIREYTDYTRKNGFFKENRNRQVRNWIHEMIRNRLIDDFYGNPAVKDKIKEIETSITKDEVSPVKAVQILLDLFRK